jgi:hypothetical protein
MTPPATISRTPLAAGSARALGVQGALLVLAAVVLPALAHAAGVAGNAVLPMHWPVLLAGLCYGRRAGALLGIAAPLAAFALSGMPPVVVLPAMAAELATYGAVAGLAHASRPALRVAATALALVLGRAVFVLAMGVQHGDATGAFAGLASGAVAALVQLAVLPLVATWWVRREATRG